MTTNSEAASDGKILRSPAFTALVCGGRDFADRDAVYRALDTLLKRHPNLTVLHGACETGADHHAQAWADAAERPSIRVPAEWKKHGKAAGPIRNAMMLHYLPHGCVAFPGGTGTADMVRQAEAAGVKVWRP